MHICHSLENIPTSLQQPIALTIGSFDGVHLGHQSLLAACREHGSVALLTFRNHPSSVLAHRTPPKLIYPIQQKVRLLEAAGVALLLLVDFTPQLAEQTAEEFLSRLHNKLPFSFLILGEGAVLGKGRQGDAAHLQLLGHKLGFTPLYIPKVILEGEPVSSQRIREALDAGDIAKASRLLGRPYGLYPFEAP